MAKYRQVYVEFWQDAFVIDLTPEEKYFFLYIMTNGKTTQCGIYELPKKLIQLETDLSREKIDNLIAKFTDHGKIRYNDTTKEIMLNNWAKYNSLKSPKVRKCIETELQNVKDTTFVDYYLSIAERYGYSINTPSKDYGEEQEKERKEEHEEEQEKEREEEERDDIPFFEIVNYLNQKANKNFSHLSERNQNDIKARWEEGYQFEDFKKVIDIKSEEWLKSDFNLYLRPITLFGEKFEDYLNQQSNEGDDDLPDWVKNEEDDVMTEEELAAHEKEIQRLMEG